MASLRPWRTVDGESLRPWERDDVFEVLEPAMDHGMLLYQFSLLHTNWRSKLARTENKNNDFALLKNPQLFCNFSSPYVLLTKGKRSHDLFALAIPRADPRMARSNPLQLNQS
jgi:hypothetical protein